MEEQQGLIGAGVPALVDGPEHQAVFPREIGALEDDGIPDAPAVPGRQLAPGHGAPAVLDQGQLLVFGHEILRVGVEVAGQRGRELGEKVALVDIDAFEPVGVGHPDNAGHGLDLGKIGQGQGKHQGHGVPRHQAHRGGGVHPGVPGGHHGAQQTKGQHRHRHPQDGEGGPQGVPESIAPGKF